MVFEVINSYKRSEYAISEDKIILLKNPGAPAPVTDALTELLREGAQRMLAAASEAEVAAFLERFKDEKTADGRQRVVRRGMVICRRVPSRPASAQSRPRCRGCGTGRRRSSLPRRFCRPTFGGPKASKNCCPGYT